VASIDLFTTTLVHPDRSRVIIPNRKIVGEILHNYGTIRQLDLTWAWPMTPTCPSPRRRARGPESPSGGAERPAPVFWA